MNTGSVDTSGGECGELGVEVLAGGADPCADRRHTDHCLIAQRRWGFETRAARQETRQLDLGDTCEGSGGLSVVSLLYKRDTGARCRYDVEVTSTKAYWSSSNITIVLEDG